MTREIIFVAEVHGIPKAQPRPRAFARGGRARIYDPGTAEAWKNQIATACRQMREAHLTHPISVTLRFFMPRPKSHYRTNGELKPTTQHLPHIQKPDVDNLAKAVLDALTDIRLWKDDALVCELKVYRHWEQPGIYPPGCLIEIFKLKEQRWNTIKNSWQRWAAYVRGAMSSSPAPPAPENPPSP